MRLSVQLTALSCTGRQPCLYRMLVSGLCLLPSSTCVHAARCSNLTLSVDPGLHGELTFARARSLRLTAVQPSSLYARWPPALAQTAVPLVVNALTQSSLGGAFVGRWTVQCRSYRMATETSKRADGQVDGSSGLSARSSRTLVVVRSTATPDEIWTFVEDPKAPARKMAGAAAAASSSNGNGGASTAAQSQQLLSPPHTRWSTCNFVAPAAPVDTFLHRVLTSGGAGGQGAWTSKPSTWIFEGLSFLTGATPLAPGGEWLVRVGSVTTKGGAKTQNKGVILHVRRFPTRFT